MTGTTDIRPVSKGHRSNGQRSDGHHRDGHQSVGELVGQATEQFSRLVRQELALAKHEFTEKGRRAGRGGGLLGAAGAFAYAGLLALAGTGVAALSLTLPVWAAALIVTAVLFVIMRRAGRGRPRPTAPGRAAHPRGDPRQRPGRRRGDQGEGTPMMTDRTAADLRRQIERTRHRLGVTVEELAARADVRGRTRARAADLMDRAGAMTVQLRSTASQAGYHMQERAGRAGHAVQERASRAGHAAQAKAGHTAQGRGGRARHAVQDAAARVGRTAQDHALHARHDLRDDVARAGRTAERSAPAPVREPVRFALRHPRPVVIVGAAAVALVAAGVIGRRRAKR